MNIYTCYLGYLFVNPIFEYIYWVLILYYEQSFLFSWVYWIFVDKDSVMAFLQSCMLYWDFCEHTRCIIFWHQASALVIISCVLVPYIWEDNCTWLDALDLVKWVLMHYKMKDLLSSTTYCILWILL